jgi:MFS family permease
LLLLASTINYMDRQTLASASIRINKQFELSKEQYGKLESYFGYAFAAGSTLFGVAADRWSVRWLYPLVLALWSAVGFATGLVKTYDELLVCRTLLGFFEGGHWPCAIKTTQCLLEARDRALGNSVLQSGTSIGAILTPLIMGQMLTAHLESWRLPFQVVGAAGLLWVVAWLLLVRTSDLAPAPSANSATRPANPANARKRSWVSEWSFLWGRRMLVLFFVVACLNTSWQMLRAWLPQFLVDGRHYTEKAMLDFQVCFYIATDIGCIGAGALTLWFIRRKASVHASRLGVFALCAGVSALTAVAAFQPKGAWLLVLLAIIGAGTLGLFPIYHAFTQDVSAAHQGKVTGLTGLAAWLSSAPAHTLFGRLVDRTKSFDLGLALAGLLPLAACAAIWLFWGKEAAPSTGSGQATDSPSQPAHSG